MAGFFILSGMTFSAKREPLDNLLHKSKALLLPYLCFCFVYLAYLWIKALAFGGPAFDLQSGLLSIIAPESGKTSTSVYGLWFFPCLFLTEIILYWIVRLNRTSAILLSLFVVACCMIVHHVSDVVTIVSIVPISLFFTAVGYYARYHIDECRKSSWMALISLFAFSSALWINYYFHGHVFDLSSFVLGFWPLYMVCGLSGSMVIYCCASRLSNNGLLKRLGRNSMYYYGLHYCLIGFAERIPHIGAVGQTILVMAALYPVIALWHRIRT